LADDFFDCGLRRRKKDRGETQSAQPEKPSPISKNAVADRTEGKPAQVQAQQQEVHAHGTVNVGSK
jgi:hypothetical protein